MHYYSFNIGDWNLATSHLSPEEEAIYFRLINYYYDTEAPIPTETQSVFRRLRLGSCSDVARLILDEFFTLKDDGWHHSRCDEELRQYAGKRETNRVNGRKGGRPSKRGAASKGENPVGFSGKPNSNPDITLTNNQEPITKELSIDNSPPVVPQREKTRKGKKLPIGFQFPQEWIDLALTEMRCKPSAVDADQLGFIHYYTNGRGKNESHIDWRMTWQNWYRKSYSECSKANAEINHGKRRAGIESIQDRVKGDIAQRNAGRSAACAGASVGNTLDGEFERVAF